MVVLFLKRFQCFLNLPFRDQEMYYIGDVCISRFVSNEQEFLQPLLSPPPPLPPPPPSSSPYSGADINAINSERQNALHMAAVGDHASITSGKDSA